MPRCCYLCIKKQPQPAFFGFFSLLSIKSARPKRPHFFFKIRRIKIFCRKIFPQKRKQIPLLFPFRFHLYAFKQAAFSKLFRLCLTRQKISNTSFLRYFYFKNAFAPFIKAYFYANPLQSSLIYVKIFCKTIFPIRGDIKCQDIPNGVPSNAKKKA